MPAQHTYRPQHLALAIALALGCADFAIAQQPMVEPSSSIDKSPQALIKDFDAFIKSATSHPIKKAEDWSKLQLGDGDDLVKVHTQDSFDGKVDGGAGSNVMQLDAAKGGKVGETHQFQRLDVKKGTWTLTGSGDFSTGALIRPKTTLTNEGSIAGGALVQGALFNKNEIGGDVAVLSGGTLSNMGNIGGSVEIYKQAAFSGKGSVGALDVDGLIVVNRLQGAPMVKGDMSLSKTAVLSYEVNPDGSSETIKVDGTAKLDSTTLKVVTTEGEFPQSSQYTIIEANKIEGQFGTVISDLAFMTPTPQYNEKNVGLTYARNEVPIESLADTDNGREFGKSVIEPLHNSPEVQIPSVSENTVVAEATPTTSADTLLTASTPSTAASASATTQKPVSNAAVTALLASNKETASYALEQLAGSSNANLAKATLSSVDPVSASLLSAMRQLGTDNQSTRNNAPRLAAGSEDNGRVWLQALGHGGKLDRDIEPLQHSTKGLLLGADWSIDEEWRLGVMGGSSRTQLDSRELDGNLDSWHLGAYALRQNGPMSLRLGATYGSHDGSTARRVAFSGFSDRPKGSYDANTQQAFAEVGYNLGRYNVSFEPFASIGYQRYQRDGYTEKGGAAALKVNDQAQSNMNSTFGLRLAKVETLDNGMRLTPRLSAGWKHTYGELYTHTRQRLVTGGNNYTVYGAELDRNSLLLDAGLDLGVSTNHSVGVGLTGEVGSDSRSYGVMGQWRIAF